MKQILTDMVYHIYWDENNKIVYIRDNIKVKHLDTIRYELIMNKYYYKNIIIGIRYDGEV